MLLDTIRTAGIIVGIFYYIMTLRNQNMTRKGQLLMQTFTRVDTLQRQKALLAMFDIKYNDFSEFLAKYGPDSGTEYWEHIGNMQLFTECLGGMVREKYIDISGVATLLGGGIVYYWNMLKPIKNELTPYLYPRWCVETEYLYNELLKYGKKHPELKIS